MSQSTHGQQPGQPASTPSPAEEKPETAPAPETAVNERGKVGGAPVFVYLAIMFAAAFLLLLMAYLMQEHNSRTVIADLRESLDISRDSLTEENQTLRAELQSLLEQVDTLQDQLDSAESGYLTLQGEFDLLSQTYQAVLTLEQLERLCQQEQPEPARSLLAQSEDLAELLAQADQSFRLPSGGQSSLRPPTFTQRLADVTALLAEQPDL